VQDEYTADKSLEHDMKQLLVRLEKEPVSDEIRELAKKLQKHVNDSGDTAKDDV